jgi:hypothetical protein
LVEQDIVSEKGCVPPPIAQEVAEQVAAANRCRNQLMEPSQPLAFQGKNQWESRKNPWEFMLASTDEFEHVSDEAAGTCMRVFFVCLGGGPDDPCMTIQESKQWAPKSGVQLNPNCWFCTCGARYKSKFGVIVEIVVPGVDGILYCRAPVPDEHVNDMRHIMHELKIKPASSNALYNAVPVCKPSSTSLIIRKEVDRYGKPCDNRLTFRSKKDYHDLPECEWDQVFHLAGYELPPKPLTRRQKKELRWTEDYNILPVIERTQIFKIHYYELPPEYLTRSDRKTTLEDWKAQNMVGAT